MPTELLAPADKHALVDALRHGQGIESAADALGLDLAAVWATARTDTRLTIALAGRDPDAPEEAGRAARAEFLRLLALGVPPTRAELILGVGEPGKWRGGDPAYARACAAATDASVRYRSHAGPRLTVQNVAKFLDALRVSGTTVRSAAATAGITTQAVYQRRRRDTQFAAAMDAARESARRAD
ncbi:hypothetical protein [Streptomyces sp. NPDC057740]|uniref:hypothetical protein n=1 Tax=Streptomyces sp. NPDC057740 TaxID=3346234 RepID=UPI00368BCA49